MDSIKKLLPWISALLVIAVAILIVSLSEEKNKFHEVKAFNDIVGYLNEVDQDTLVVFDVDNVLIRPDDAILFSGNKKYRQKKFEELKERHSGEQYDYLKGIIELNCKRRLVNSSIPDTIDTLNQRGVKVVALSSMHTGPLGVIQDRQVLRVKELKDLGLQFHKSFTELPEHFVLEDIVSEKSNQPAAYLKGVICASGAPKGEVLDAFLRKANYMPKKIIFIDNRIQKLRSVQEACTKMGIAFQGFQYLEAFENYEKEDPRIANFQFEYLEKNKKWLSDEEAGILINY